MKKSVLILGFIFLGSFSFSKNYDTITSDIIFGNLLDENVQSSPKAIKCYNYVYDENGKIIGKVEVPCPDEIIIIKD